MSQRTDLNDQSTQPVRSAPGGDYGDRQGAEQEQSAAPMQAASAPPGLMGGAFGPTGRPNEPITAGAALGPGPGAPPEMEPDPDMLLRAMYRKYPHPDLERLLQRRRMY